MNIEAKNLSKIYGDGENRVVALDHANLEIVSSDFISIMGPSGSGKSTLLHLLSGLDKPSSGSLTYDGKDIYSYSDKELSAFRRKRIGFIFQQFNLLPVLTAKENIIMPLLLDKQKPDEAYLKQLTELLGIQGRLEHLPHELSGGQQQRVAIARALIAKPDVIFADEPTGNLDSESAAAVIKVLGEVAKDKLVVVVTHNYDQFEKYATRRIKMNDGRITEDEVFSKPKPSPEVLARLTGERGEDKKALKDAKECHRKGRWRRCPDKPFLKDKAWIEECF